MAAMIGVEDKIYGEEIVACLVLHDNASVSSDQLKQWGKEQLGAHKYPRVVQIVESLPMTATGKALKRELREQFMSDSKAEN